MCARLERQPGNQIALSWTSGPESMAKSKAELGIHSMPHFSTFRDDFAVVLVNWASCLPSSCVLSS
jgi:hypothetical protein